MRTYASREHDNPTGRTTHVSRRILTWLPTLVLGPALALLAAAAPSAATDAATAAGNPTFRVDRLAGPDRYAAAVAISRQFYSAGSATVVIASGEAFADGMSAGAYAAKLSAPVLFVSRTRVPSATTAELARLRPVAIHVLGGPATVSDDVLTQLSAWSQQPPVRLGGADRFAVAAAASSHFSGPLRTVYVASGRVWPDGLAGGAAAAVDGAPILLTEPDRLPSATAAEIRRLAPDRIVLLGGPASVQPAVATSLGQLAPVERVWGPDRYATAEAISARFFGPARPGVMYATGRDFPDALAGAAAAVVTRGPILLTRNLGLSTPERTELRRLGPARVYVLGGPASVPIEVPRAAQRELGICWAGKPPSSSSQDVVTKIYGTTSPKLAFTLDMGGRMEGAADIVRYLIDNQVCTTFFPTSIMADTTDGRAVMALVAAHPELFEVGNHTVHHCDLVLGGGGSPSALPCQRSMTDAFVRAELTDADSVLSRLSGMSVRPYWRPPYGSNDARVRGIAASVGYPKTMLWSRDTADWDPRTSTAAIIKAVTDPTPESGTIVLAHLGGYNTGEALRTIVPTLRARGLTFTTISDMWDD